MHEIVFASYYNVGMTVHHGTVNADRCRSSPCTCLAACGWRCGERSVQGNLFCARESVILREIVTDWNQEDYCDVSHVVVKKLNVPGGWATVARVRRSFYSTWGYIHACTGHMVTSNAFPERTLVMHAWQ